MAVTYAIVSRDVTGSRRILYVDITGPASYTSGGEALTAAQLNAWMPEFAGKLAATDSDRVTFFTSEHNAADQFMILDKANDKVMFFTDAGQVSGSANLSAVTLRARVEYFA